MVYISLNKTVFILTWETKENLYRICFLISKFKEFLNRAIKWEWISNTLVYKYDYTPYYWTVLHRTKVLKLNFKLPLITVFSSHFEGSIKCNAVSSSAGVIGEEWPVESDCMPSNLLKTWEQNWT